MTDQNETAQASPEAKAAATEFLKGFNLFKDDVSKRMSDISTRMESFERKGAETRRPALSGAAETQPPHLKAFAAYVRQGDDDQLRSLDLGTKGITTVAADGGFLVDPKTSEMIDHVLRSGASLRALARVVQVEASAYDVLIDHAEMGAGWQEETTALADQAQPAIDRISVPLHELSASPKASQRILDDAAFDVEAWLAERIADRFLRAESAAFVSGDGVNKPSGFLTKTMVDNGSWSWGNIGYVPTGVSGGFDSTDPADAVIELVYSLGAEYRANGAFVMNSKTAGEMRKMKDPQGRFLWAEGLMAEQPARLMGYPVSIVEDMPNIGANSYSIAFGDFSHAYTIAERPDIRLLRDPYSSRPNVAFFATKRVGGDVTDFAAIKLLKFGAS
ncbi:MAG: phage major capsid protein [Pseudomonadota bacterium]